MSAMRNQMHGVTVSLGGGTALTDAGAPGWQMSSTHALKMQALHQHPAKVPT
jgi:hypothetical protein